MADMWEENVDFFLSLFRVHCLCKGLYTRSRCESAEEDEGCFNLKKKDDFQRERVKKPVIHKNYPAKSERDGNLTSVPLVKA